MERQKSRIPVLPVDFCDFETLQLLGLKPKYRKKIKQLLRKAFEPVQGTAQVPKQDDMEKANVAVLKKYSQPQFCKKNFFTFEMFRRMVSWTGGIEPKNQLLHNRQPIFHVCKFCTADDVENCHTWKGFRQHLQHYHELLPHQYLESSLGGLVFGPASVIYGNISHQELRILYEMCLVQRAIQQREFHKLCFYQTDASKCIINITDKIELKNSFYAFSPQNVVIYRDKCNIGDDFRVRVFLYEYAYFSAATLTWFLTFQIPEMLDSNWKIGYIPLVQRRIINQQFPLFYKEIENCVCDDLIPDMFMFYCDLYHQCVELYNKK